MSRDPVQPQRMWGIDNIQHILVLLDQLLFLQPQAENVGNFQKIRKSELLSVMDSFCTFWSFFVKFDKVIPKVFIINIMNCILHFYGHCISLFSSRYGLKTFLRQH
jgi:hypothetical protein